MSIADFLLHGLIGMLPVGGFLAALLYLDSYKLVAMRTVLGIVASGVLVAIASYFANGAILDLVELDFVRYSRYGAPFVEELGKALVVVALLRLHRIGFLVDAAILGFAVGTGFSIVENVYYQVLVPDAGIGTWIVRGFGTAIMHGGTTAIFAMVSLVLVERLQRTASVAFVPGYLLAVAIHAAFNQMYVSPRLSTLIVFLTLPPLMYVVFRRSEQATADWLGHGFDEDTRMIESITSGQFADSPSGQYLATLKRRFHGPIVADLLCYLRLHTELALRAKGILMMSESGFAAGVDDATRAKLVEMRYLERSIGRAGHLALRPLLSGGHKDIWQLRMLESASSAAAGAVSAMPRKASE
jgi:protease PrsW